MSEERDETLVCVGCGRPSNWREWCEECGRGEGLQAPGMMAVAVDEWLERGELGKGGEAATQPGASEGDAGKGGEKPGGVLEGRCQFTTGSGLPPCKGVAVWRDEVLKIDLCAMHAEVLYPDENFDASRVESQKEMRARADKRVSPSVGVECMFPVNPELGPCNYLATTRVNGVDLCSRHAAMQLSEIQLSGSLEAPNLCEWENAGLPKVYCENPSEFINSHGKLFCKMHGQHLKDKFPTVIHTLNNLWKERFRELRDIYFKENPEFLKCPGCGRNSLGGVLCAACQEKSRKTPLRFACPDCGKPTVFGILCPQCRNEREALFPSAKLNMSPGDVLEIVIHMPDGSSRDAGSISISKDGDSLSYKSPTK